MEKQALEYSYQTYMQAMLRNLFNFSCFINKFRVPILYSERKKNNISLITVVLFDYFCMAMDIERNKLMCFT